LRDYFRAAPGQEAPAIERLQYLSTSGARALSLRSVVDYCGLLNAELFFCPDRIRFYERLLASVPHKVYLVIYDFLPWLRPEFFGQGSALPTLDYLRLLRKVKHAAFISEATRNDYLTRVLRENRETGPVLALGSDSFGFRPPRTDPGPPHFTVLGSLEPRKNPRPVLRAFQSLWDEGHELTLAFVGRLVGTLGEEDRLCIEKLQKTEPRFSWETKLDDQSVRHAVCESRATIYPSLAEGFGLPPLESLALGVPVIASDGIPSISMIDPLGQVRLVHPDSASIRQAVLRFLDDDFARRKANEIRQLKLPTWDGMVRTISDWIEGNHQSTVTVGG